MSASFKQGHLPDYASFVASIQPLTLPLSASELHGLFCGYVCAGQPQKAEAYCQVIMAKGKMNEAARAAATSIFELYALSKLQLNASDFGFQLLIPDDDVSLIERSKAFAEWCDGFTEALASSGVSYDELDDEDAQQALSHLLEFSQLDMDELEVSEEDEKAFMEVCEYTRVAVFTLAEVLQDGDDASDNKDIAH